jgi:signal transduction histidine kinase
MTSTSSPEVRVERSGVSEHAGAARWLTIHDELLRGLAHTLSNRVATIDAATYMLALDGADVASQIGTLRGETERLEALLHALRALPRHDSGSGAEPVMPGDAVQGALALHAHHGELRDVPCDVNIDVDVAPAYADPVALQHALLVALTAARTGAHRARGRVAVHVSSGADVVRFALITSGDGTDGDGASDEVSGRERVSDALAIDWLLGAHGGRSEPSARAIAFTVPTLAAARRHASPLGG